MSPFISGGDGGFDFDMEPVTRDDRATISRVRGAILCLAKHSVMLYDTSIQYAYDASMDYEVCVRARLL